MPSKYFDTPGPSHYTPRDTLIVPNTPKYSIQGRETLLQNRTLPYPSPADRDIRVQSTGGSFSLTRKGNTCPYARRENHHITPSPGPNIQLKYNNLDASSVGRWTLGGRNKEGVIQGHPGTFAQPVDTHGFRTPGPAEYIPHPQNAVSGPMTSFGMKLRDADPETGVPGPGAYEISSCFDSTAGLTMRERLAPLSRDQIPAPNAYCLPDTNPNIKYSLQSRNMPRTRHTQAAPNTYTLSTVDDTAGKYSRRSSLQYKSFDPYQPSYPDPSTYDTSPPFPSDTSPLPGAQCRPGFPDVLHYPEYAPICTPSPSAYTPSFALTRPLDPVYSFGVPHHHVKHFSPSPNTYNTQGIKTSLHVHPPSYSMRPSTVDIAKFSYPPPSQYHPTDNMKRSAPLFSFGRKHQHEAKVGQSGLPDTLSPTTYVIPENLTHKGVMNAPAYSIKGKISPRVYNGFSNSSILAKLSTIS